MLVDVSLGQKKREEDSDLLQSPDDGWRAWVDQCHTFLSMNGDLHDGPGCSDHEGRLTKD